MAESTELSETKAKQLRFGASQLIKQEQEVCETAERFGITVEDGVVKLPAEVLAEIEEEAEEKVEAVEAVEAEAKPEEAGEEAVEAALVDETQAVEGSTQPAAETL